MKTPEEKVQRCLAEQRKRMKPDKEKKKKKNEIGDPSDAGRKK